MGFYNEKNIEINAETFQIEMVWALNKLVTYREKWFDVLQQIEAAICEIGLLRNFNIVADNIESVEYMISGYFYFGPVFTCQVIA